MADFDIFGKLNDLCNTNILDNIKGDSGEINGLSFESKTGVDQSKGNPLNDDSGLEAQLFRAKSSLKAVKGRKKYGQSNQVVIHKVDESGISVQQEPGPRKRQTRLKYMSTEVENLLAGKSKQNKQRRSSRRSNDLVVVEDDVSVNAISEIQAFESSGKRVMRARREYLKEVSCRAPCVDFIDLVSSPVPRVTGFIDLDSDNETTESSNANAIEKSTDDSFCEDNPQINVKINWNGKRETFVLRKFQKFAHIFNIIADREQRDIDKMVFNLKERIIEPDDTPNSIDYRIYHVIDGRILIDSKINAFESYATTKETAAKGIRLKIQVENRKQPLLLNLEKTAKFKILYILASEEINVPWDKIRLSFDGETLDYNGRPEDLEFEGDEIIDLRILK